VLAAVALLARVTDASVDGADGAWVALTVGTSRDGGSPGRDLGDCLLGLGCGCAAAGGAGVADVVRSAVLSSSTVSVGGATKLGGGAGDADVVGTADMTGRAVRVNHAAVLGVGGASEGGCSECENSDNGVEEHFD
jgi:hypothetical protein